MKKRPMTCLDTILNRYLSLDPEMAEKMAAFESRVIAIKLQGMDKTFYLFPQTRIKDECIKLSEHYDGVPDTVLNGSPAALFKMGLASDVAPKMLKGEVEISGDMRLGLEFKKLLAEINIDWEEHLASFIGDAPAHQATGAAKRFVGWANKAKQAILADVSEYLQEEGRDVVTGAELEMFYEDVDNMRNDVDRLQAKVESLKKEVKRP